jgi:hypothetical protein
VFRSGNKGRVAIHPYSSGGACSEY